MVATVFGLGERRLCGLILSEGPDVAGQRQFAVQPSGNVGIRQVSDRKPTDAIVPLIGFKDEDLRALLALGQRRHHPARRRRGDLAALSASELYYCSSGGRMPRNMKSRLRS